MPSRKDGKRVELGKFNSVRENEPCVSAGSHVV